VAHNGVLTNFKELKEKYIPDHPNLVDTSIIPALLDIFEKDYDNCNTPASEIKCISHVLCLLEGTFGLWLINIKTLNVYLVRQGSTLFYDTNSFSSTPGEGYSEIKEGKIYRFYKKGIKSVGTFKNKSPFLEL
jgi:glucosamine 6-phosphate synthetase-like amidotransferase/phosphosugar isomerase protein